MKIVNIRKKKNSCDISYIESYLRENLYSYEYDQYRNYIAKNMDMWVNYYFFRLQNIVNDPEYLLFCAIDNEELYLLGCRLSSWDKVHFGISMANISVLYHPQNPSSIILLELIDELLSYLRDEAVKFASFRVNGDDLIPIHVIENLGFRYYETVIWPVRPQSALPADSYQGIRLMEEQDLERIMYIASHYQYKRGHFHCDNHLNQNKVDHLYAKWIKSAFEKKESVVIIERKGVIAGYFVVNIDIHLSHYLGFRYGRMKSLALDSSFRGDGLGMRLFRGAINFLTSAGAQVIDSGYSTKNHISAKLHSSNNYHSVYEEVTFHLWL
jgi:L-amino acid N-acyltransferase YncA